MMDVTGRTINPLDIPEILHYVLEHVGVGPGGTQQLLKSRLVCHSWNIEALKLIPPQQAILSNTDFDSEREVKFRQMLDSYLQILPGLDLTFKAEMTGHPNTLIKFNNENLDNYTWFIQDMSSVFPTTSINIKSCLNIETDYLLKLIKIVAPVLKELKTSARFFHPSNNKPPLTLIPGSIEFPCLETIEYWIPPPAAASPPNPFQIIPHFVTTMVQKSSSTLTSLTLAEQPVVYHEQLNVRDKAPALQQFLNDNGILATLNHLQRFEISVFDDDQFIRSLCSIQFNQLTSLILHEIYSHHFQPPLLEFLAGNKCPLLTELGIVMMHTPWFPYTLEFELQRLLQVQIHKIKTLGLFSCRINSIRILKNLLLMSLVFPPVVRFNTDIKTLIHLRQLASGGEGLDFHYQRPGGEYRGLELSYPTVTSLNVKVDETNDHGHVIDDGDVEGLRFLCRKMWPNLKTLIIEKMDSEATLASNGMLINLLTMTEGITSLELRTNIMMDEVEDWLTEIFKPNPDLQQFKQNLRVLKLKLPSSATSLKQQKHESAELSTYLQSICETLVNLENLSIDEGLLRNPQQLSFDQLIDLSQLRIRFPNIKFEAL